jgi:hypothetical protein
MVTSIVISFLQFEGIHAVFITDDICITAPTYESCLQDRDRALYILESLNIIVNSKKTTDPSTTGAFVGIVLDSTSLQLRIPSDKLAEYSLDTTLWFAQYSTCPSYINVLSSDLVSFLGKCERISLVFPEGKLHLHYLWTILPYYHGHFISNQRIRVDGQALQDLYWWHSQLIHAITHSLDWARSWDTLPNITNVYSDASGSGQFGIVIKHHVIQGRIQIDSALYSSSFLELLPIWVLLQCCGPLLSHSILYLHTDNLNNSRSINRMNCSAPDTYPLLQSILQLACSHHICLLSVWLPRSRLELLDFFSKQVL